MLKYSKIRLKWKIQKTWKNPVTFRRALPLNVLAPAFLWLQCKFHNILWKTKWPPRKFEDFMASGCPETHFRTFSMIWATFYTHQNHCYLYAFFSSQHQSANIEQKLTRSLHFIGFSAAVGGHPDRLGHRHASAPTYWRKRGVYLFTGLDYWTGLLEWTTGLQFLYLEFNFCGSSLDEY